MAARTKSSEITLLRFYEAPLEAVWDAWTDPLQVAQWWGPRGFTLTHHSRDLRTGGHWHYTMHGPDGTDYENTTRYLEVVPRQRLVYDHGGHADRPPLFRVTVLFSESGGRTRLDLGFALASVEAAEQVRQHIRQAGGEATWDRLAEYLDTTGKGVERFFISRGFDASLERMWECWTEPDQIARWLPPVGGQMRFIRADVRVGGTSFYEMTVGGQTLHGRLHYLALERPHRIVYEQQFCDPQERVIQAPFFEHWPLTMATVVELVAEGPERTLVTVRWEPGSGATAEQVAEFVRQRPGMTGGWGGSLDKLEALVAG